MRPNFRLVEYIHKYSLTYITYTAPTPQCKPRHPSRAETLTSKRGATSGPATEEPALICAAWQQPPKITYQYELNCDILKYCCCFLVVLVVAFLSCYPSLIIVTDCCLWLISESCVQPRVDLKTYSFVAVVMTLSCSAMCVRKHEAVMLGWEASCFSQDWYFKPLLVLTGFPM